MLIQQYSVTTILLFQHISRCIQPTGIYNFYLSSPQYIARVFSVQNITFLNVLEIWKIIGQSDKSIQFMKQGS